MTVNLEQLIVAFQDTATQHYYNVMTGELRVAAENAPAADEVVFPTYVQNRAVEDVEAFLETVEHVHVQEVLLRAIRRQAPLERFEETIRHYPDEQTRWRAFRTDCIYHHITTWLNQYNARELE